MTMGFKGMGWFLCGLVVAPGCYVVMSQVATERARVESVERAIRQANRDIRNLETEFRTRANFAQLERWNGEVFALAAPQPEQFADGIADLAARGMGQGDAAMRYASYVVPTMTSEIDEAVQGGIQRAAAESAAATAVRASSPASAQIGSAGTSPATASPPAKVDAEREAKPKVARPVPTQTAASSSARKPPRAEVAALDRKLLSDSTLGDLMKSARSEARTRN